jgi:hypothetical protein
LDHAVKPQLVTFNGAIPSTWMAARFLHGQFGYFSHDNLLLLD